MNLIQSPQKAISVWLLAIASTLAGLELFLPQLENVLPSHWLAVVVPVILVARLIAQGKPKPPREPVRIVERADERGWVPFYLLPLVALFAFVSLFLIGCSDPKATKTASHLASNSTAEALSWLDARLAAQYEIASAAEVERLAKVDGSAADWERWRLESGWAVTVESVALAYDAHALLVAHLDGTKASTAEQRQQALAAVTKAIHLGLTMLEQEKVPVPSYVRVAAAQLPALGALL